MSSQRERSICPVPLGFSEAFVAPEYTAPIGSFVAWFPLPMGSKTVRVRLVTGTGVPLTTWTTLYNSFAWSVVHDLSQTIIPGLVVGPSDRVGFQTTANVANIIYLNLTYQQVAAVV